MERRKLGGMDALLGLELFFVGLLALASAAIVWIAGLTVWNLFRGQR